MRFKSCCIILFLVGVAGFLPAAGQSDTLAGMRRFVKVCSDYKTLPVQLEVEISRTSNMVLSRADTSTLRASFYLNKSGSYIEMEGVEQLANDSLLLLVNKTTKRMVVAPNHQSVTERLQQLLGQVSQDSNILELSGKYSVREMAEKGDTATIGLKSRLTVPKSSLPKEELIARYNRRTGNLIEVLAMNRNLLSVSDSACKAASEFPEWAGKTISFKSGHDSSFYLIKEQQTVFRYLKIAHAPAAPLPAQISDRLVSIGPGKYRPASSYADFVLSKQY